MKNNVVVLYVSIAFEVLIRLIWNIRALRAMIAEFAFFVCIAAICFSGLLFTLHTLSTGGSQPWAWKSIAWLMVQVWFGNTYLSFSQASSFHPFFGPFLMTGFAALSNTLLLTSKFQWRGKVCSAATGKLNGSFSIDLDIIKHVRQDQRGMCFEYTGFGRSP